MSLSGQRARSLAGVRRAAALAAMLLATSMATGPRAQASPASGHPRAPALDAAFNAAFEAGFERFQLPGLAVGVVANGRVVFRRTAGELVAGSGQPVTPRSLFKIASLSKAMTTAMLARLADQQRLDWHDPVRRHLPGFRMHDPWVGANMQLRDLLIHNSGLGKGAGDLMLWPEPNHFTREDVIAGLAHLVPTHSFRSHYAYDNILYFVAGEAAAAAAGAPYEALMQREVFGPLGLDRCHAGGFDREAVGEVAQPHIRLDGRNRVVRADGPSIPTLASAAAGGIRCSLDDMLAWIGVWLGDHPASARWLSAAQREALWTPHMPMPLSQRQRAWERAHFHSYGYGWRLSDFHGLLKVSHTGTLAGMYALLVLLPERDAGFVVLTNGYGEAARTVLGQVLAERLAGLDGGDVAHYAALLEAAPRAPEGAAMPDVSGRVPLPADDLAGRLGRWRDPWFGEVAICARNGTVRFQAAKSPRLAGTVMRWQDRLLVDWDADSVDAMPWLHFPEGAGVLRLSHVDPEADFSYDYADLAFTRVGDCVAGPG